MQLTNAIQFSYPISVGGSSPAQVSPRLRIGAHEIHAPKIACFFVVRRTELALVLVGSSYPILAGLVLSDRPSPSEWSGLTNHRNKTMTEKHHEFTKNLCTQDKLDDTLSQLEALANVINIALINADLETWGDQCAIASRTLATLAVEAQELSLQLAKEKSPVRAAA